jgi:hypothetical protein
LVTDATAAFSPDGMKAAATNAPTIAHATEALMSRLPTVNGKRALPEPESNLIASLLIPLSVARCRLPMNGRFAPEAVHQE